jgi:hypothetical protein
MQHVIHKWIQAGCFRPAGQLILSLFVEQCANAFVRCDEFIEQVCRERDKTLSGRGFVAGFSNVGTCTVPQPSIFWCSKSFKDPLRAKTCQAEGLVHEFAHSCGFRHDDDALQAGEVHDYGVPGHDGVLYDCEA